MDCIVCNCKETRRVRYNNHLKGFNVKAKVKNLLPYFNFMIPESLSSIKKLAVGRKYFNGYIYVCSECGHGFLANPPDEESLLDYYKQAYWSHRADKDKNALIIKNSFKEDSRAKQQVAFLSEHVQLERLENILEIGAGPANASQLIRMLSNNTSQKIFVYEPGLQWEQYYQKYEIKKISDYFPSDTDIKFDYIHTSHWFEHTRDMDITLKAVRDLLNDDGYVFIEVPNEEHYYWDLQIEDTPHLQFFTRNSLKKIMEKHYFKCVEIGEYGISYLDRKNGIKVTEENSGKSEKGFWIRGLFKK